jgi:hypothetical protein
VTSAAERFTDTGTAVGHQRAAARSDRSRTTTATAVAPSARDCVGAAAPAE